MIPIDNSLGGRVADIHHLLPDSKLFIVGEHFQPVQHCLLGVPGSTLEGLERVESHPQALAQTREMLIEDRLGNTTRFVIMSRRRIEPDLHEGPVITSFVFQVRSVPAALYKALGGFATTGVNITKLESYIIDASFTVAQFYAEIDGHPSDKDVAHAFEELQFFCKHFKLLGVYPRAAFRKSAPLATTR